MEFVRGSVRGGRRRARSWLPSLFTLANMMCGFGAMLVAFRGEYRLACALIALSIVFDIADGAVARLVGAVSPFGLQFDSLADLVSFGLAPSLLVFALFSDGRDNLDALAWIACFLWVACAAIRLARFNTTIDPTADKRYFTGLPSPGAAGVVLASVFAFADQLQGRDRLWMLLVVVVPGAADGEQRPLPLVPLAGQPEERQALRSGRHRAPGAGRAVLGADRDLLRGGLQLPGLAAGDARADPLGRLVPARVKEVLS